MNKPKIYEELNELEEKLEEKLEGKLEEKADKTQLDEKEDKGAVRIVNGMSADASGKVTLETLALSPTVAGSSYIRYENGIQICWGVVSITGRDIVSFPKEFKVAPSIILSNWSTDVNNTINYKAPSTSNFTIQVWHASGNVVTVATSCSWIAVGRWK